MFYGWRLVAGLFVILAFSSGLGFYNHAVFIQALAESDRYSITAASSAVSVFFLVSGVAGLGIAPLLDRYDVRLIVVSGAVLAAIGLHWIGQITALVGVVCGLRLCLVWVLAPRGCCRQPP